MAKIYTTSGVGTSQTLNEASSNRLKIYDDYDSIDTSDLVDGEIVSTKETSADGSNVYDYIDDKVESAASYSTTEQLTGGKWIDGKPIYRKVILNPTINTTLLTGVDEVVDYRVKRQCHNGTSLGYVYFDGEPSKGVETTIYINLANNEVKFNNIHSETFFRAQWVILEYTKVAD